MSMEKTYYFEPPAVLVAWAKSPEGRAEIAAAASKAEEDTKQAFAQLDKERKLTREMLLEPITL